MRDYEAQLKKNFIDLSEKLSSTWNLNQGLPWSNPLKVGIGSDQHILDTTINRGLMMLLNNDYYLDAKSYLLAEQVSGLAANSKTLHDVLSAHIADQSVHSNGINNYDITIISGSTSGNLDDYNNSLATKDYVVYLPITWSVSKINQKIASIPHNLNGHTVVFMFVIPDGYSGTPTTVQDSRRQYLLNVSNDCILFSNFINGIMFVIGDFLHQTKINNVVNFSQFTRKSQNQISDPQKYDGIIVSKFIQKLYKQINNPQDSFQLQTYNQSTDETGKNLNKIVIKGTSLNSYYSIISFNENNSKVYVKNLSFQSALETISSDSNIIDIEDAITFDSPTKNKLLVHWPLDDGKYNAFGIQPTFSGYVSQQLTKYIQSKQNLTAYDKFKSYNDCITQCINSISSQFFVDNYVINASGYVEIFEESITGNITMLSSLYNIIQNDYKSSVPSGVPIYDRQLSSSIKNKIIASSLSGTISKSAETILMNSIEQIFSAAKKVEMSIPTFMLGTKSYIPQSTTLKQIPEYVKNIKLFSQNLSSTIFSKSFIQLLNARWDMWSYYPQQDRPSDQQMCKLFCQKYLINGIFSSIDKISNKINLDVFDFLSSITDEVLKSKLILALNFPGNGYSLNDNLVPNTQNDIDYYITTEKLDHSVSATLLSPRILNPVTYQSYYFLPSSEYVKYIGDIMFNQNFIQIYGSGQDYYGQWSDIKQKGSQFVKYQYPEQGIISSSPLYDSTYDSTLTFWSKLSVTNDSANDPIINAPFFSFYYNDQLRLTIKSSSYSSLTGSITSDSKLLSGYQTSSLSGFNNLLKQAGFNKGFYPWVFWTLEFDKSSSKYYDKVQKARTRNTAYFPDLTDKFAIRARAYIFKKDENDNTIITVKKYDLNDQPFEQGKALIQYISDKRTVNYIQLPFKTDQLSGFNMRIGMSKQIQSFNSQNEENQFTYNTSYYDGYFRNIMLFKGHLTNNQLQNLFKQGILTTYSFPTQYQNDQLSSLISSKKFFLGLVSIYDSSDINIINCNTKYNGNTYI